MILFRDILSKKKRSNYERNNLQTKLKIYIYTKNLQDYDDTKNRDRAMLRVILFL